MARWRVSRGRLLLVLQAAAAGGIGLAFGWLVIREVQWAQVGRALQQASVPLLLLALGLVVVAGLLRGVRWRLLFVHERVSALRLFLVESAGVGVNNVSPLRFLGEPVQFGLLTLRDRLSGGVVLATLAAQRTFELATQVLLLGTGLLLLPPLQRFAPYILAAVVFSSLSIAALFTIGPILARVPALARLHLAQEFSRGVALMRQRKGRVAASFLLTVGYALTVGLAGWMVALATGLALPFVALVVITLATLFFSSSVPGLPGALGTFEFAAVFLVGLWAVDRSTAFSFAILLHAILFLPPMLIALLVLPREGVGSVRAVGELVRHWRLRAAAQPPEPMVVPGREGR